jgi:hypothetical protein
MFPIRAWCALLLVWSVALAGSSLAAARDRADRSFPDAATFLRQVREAVRLDSELQSGFTYVEQRKEVRISRLGKLEVGPLRTFQVFPSPRPGRTING